MDRSTLMVLSYWKFQLERVHRDSLNGENPFNKTIDQKRHEEYLDPSIRALIRAIESYAEFCTDHKSLQQVKTATMRLLELSSKGWGRAPHIRHTAERTAYLLSHEVTPEFIVAAYEKVFFEESFDYDHTTARVLINIRNLFWEVSSESPEMLEMPAEIIGEFLDQDFAELREMVLDPKLLRDIDYEARRGR